MKLILRFVNTFSDFCNLQFCQIACVGSPEVPQKWKEGQWRDSIEMERFIIVTATVRGRQYRIEKTEYRIQKKTGDSWGSFLSQMRGIQSTANPLLNSARWPLMSLSPFRKFIIAPQSCQELVYSLAACLVQRFAQKKCSLHLHLTFSFHSLCVKWQPT